MRQLSEINKDIEVIDGKIAALKAQYGNSVRDVKMDHLIEQNSGNEN